jgi:hypothetical protein
MCQRVVVHTKNSPTAPTTLSITFDPSVIYVSRSKSLLCQQKSPRSDKTHTCVLATYLGSALTYSSTKSDMGSFSPISGPYRGQPVFREIFGHEHLPAGRPGTCLTVAASPPFRWDPW